MKESINDGDVIEVNKEATNNTKKSINIIEEDEEEEDEYIEEDGEESDFDEKQITKSDELKSRKVRNARKIIFDSDSEDDSDESGEEVEDVGIPIPETQTDGEVERIICHRVNSAGENEYMVKWKGRSYIHTSWKKGGEFENDRFLKSKLQRYLNKNPLLYDECIDPFNSSFIEV